MASRPYVIMRAQNFEPVGQQVGDTWFDTTTNRLTMALPQSGLALTWSQLLIAFDGNVGNITSPLNTIFTTDLVGRGVISANLFLGNGSALTGVVATNVGTLPTLSVTGNVTGGNVISLGSISAGSNITGSNLLTGGLVSATGNVTGGNVNTAGLVSATGNVIGGNVTTAGLITATGTITGGNVNTAGLITATGNITGGNITTAGLVTGAIVSATGNVQGGNIRTAGLISATGAVTGSQFNGSGAGLTSIPNSALTNSAITVNGTAISLGGSGTITATATGTLTIGTGLGGTSYNGSTGVTITNTGVLSLANGGGITVTASTGAITLGSTATSANTAGAIVSRGASGEFSAGVITATATNARYADLAENYTADSDYAPGTVIQFGGHNEVTITTTSHSTAVAGIVSTNPAYLMNHELVSDHVAAVALTGRVPCQVIGTIAKGDRLVSSSIAGVATCLDTTQYQPGCIIGKALESYDSDTVGIIEVAVGRT